MKKNSYVILMSFLWLLTGRQILAQSGTFDFETTSNDYETILQTVDGITMSLSANNGTGMSLSLGSAPPAGMSGEYFKPLQLSETIYTFAFSAPVNISSIRVQENSTAGTYSFTPNAGTAVDLFVDNSGATAILNFVGITSFSLSGSNLINCDNIVMDASLSVCLSYFSAHQEGSAVLLNWVTESECDNAGYILERRSEGAQWQTIASYETHAGLMGQGNTSERTEYVFVDEAVACGAAYDYRLSDVSRDGVVMVQDVIAISLDVMPESTLLKPAYPNPFNPSTKIQYELAESCEVTLKVVDIRGRLVQTLVPGESKSAGSYSVHWNGRDDRGINTASGIYFLVLEADGVRKTQKVMLVR